MRGRSSRTLSAIRKSGSTIQLDGLRMLHGCLIVPFKGRQKSGPSRPQLFVGTCSALGSALPGTHAKLGQKAAIDFLSHLLERTLARLFIRPPPQDRCSMAEAATRKMVVGHFYDVFRLHRLPLGRSLGRPAAR